MKTTENRRALPAPEKQKPRFRFRYWLLLLLLPGIWWSTTQVDAVCVSPRSYAVVSTLQWEEDVILCEYTSRYRSTFTHDYVLQDGAVYFPAKRPLLDGQRLGDGYHGAWKLNPDAVLDLQTRTYVPVDAIYLGNPDKDAVLVWQRGMTLPTPSQAQRAAAEGWDWIIF